MATFNNKKTDTLLEKKFPNLGYNSAYHCNYTGSHIPTLGAGYNCVALAMDDYKRVWWPDEYNYWPAGIPRQVDVESFILCFEASGFSSCGLNDTQEAGFEKLAIFVNDDNQPQHVAKQFANDNGYWTSKLGPREEIKHWLGGISGIFIGDIFSNYGNVVIVMKKKASVIVGGQHTNDANFIKSII